MDKSNHFKKDIDRILADLKVSDSLKENTLNAINHPKQKKKFAYGIPATLIAATFIAIVLTKPPIGKQFSNYADKGNSTKDTPKILMLAPDSTPKDNNLSSDSTILSNETYSMFFSNIDEARLHFYSSLLTPSYIPDKFELSSIQGTGPSEGIIKKVYLLYGLNDKTILITINADDELNDLSLYRKININDSIGYIQQDVSDKKRIKLKWFLDNALYSIEGFASEDEAIKIAESIK